MCLVCAMWNKGKLTAKEADRALAELVEVGELADKDIIHVQEAIEYIKATDNTEVN